MSHPRLANVLSPTSTRARWAARLGGLASVCIAIEASGQVSTSASYSLLHGEPGVSGGVVASAGGGVVVDISVGSPVAGGVAEAGGGNVEVKGNFVGQLYDAVGLGVTSSPAAVPETDDVQLSAVAMMDDGTSLLLDPEGLVWSVMAGPFSGISAAGLATSVNVYEDEVGQLRGEWQALEGVAEVTVLNTGGDDFGSYAGDGLDDAWQVGFFGVDNPAAAPGADPDGDFQNNRFEELAGVDPTDRTSFFDVVIEMVPGEPEHRRLVFAPFLIDRSYTLLSSETLGAQSFVEEDHAVSGNGGGGADGSLTDTAAGERQKFYKVEISRP